MRIKRRFKSNKPQAEAGILIEPPISELARVEHPAAKDAPEPPDEPPGVYSKFHGFLVTPQISNE